MPKTAQKLSFIYTDFFIYLLTLITLFLSAININKYLSQKKVLGAQINLPDSHQDYMQIKFWQDFLEKNPTYIPGWIELKRWDVVWQIDPNWVP